MRAYIETVNVVEAEPLTVNATKRISDQLPVGEGIYRIDVRVNIALVVGTGTTPISEGELGFIKNILLRTDRNEIICNIPGRALYKIAHIKSGSAPDKDAIAAATATYSVNIPIYLAEHERLGFPRPEDTLLDSKRYNALTLEITCGTVADLLGTVGTATVTATCDVEFTRTRGPLPVDAKTGQQLARPHAYVAYDVRPPVDAATLRQLLLERAADIVVKRYYLFAVTSGTPGIPFTGTPSNGILAKIALKDQSGYVMKDRLSRMLQNDNKNYFSVESWPTGVYVIDFVQDRSHNSALITAGKSLLSVDFTVQGAPAANSLISVASESLRKLN